MQSQLEVWRMFRKFETNSSSNQIPQRASIGSKLAQLIGNHLLNLHTGGKTCVQMCWNLCTYANIMLELVDQSKRNSLSVNLLIRIPAPRNSREKKTMWDFQGNYGVQWVQISIQLIKRRSVWLSIEENRMSNWHSNARHLPLHQGPTHAWPPSNVPPWSTRACYPLNSLAFNVKI